MVVILDLGDGLTEAEEAAHRELLFRPGLIKAWSYLDAEMDTADGYKPLELGVYGYVEPFGYTPDPSLGGPCVFQRNSANLHDVAQRNAGLPNSMLHVLAEMRAYGDYVAVDSLAINGGWQWAAITRGAVMDTLEPPTTPETIEAYLAADAEVIGQEMVTTALHRYADWESGQVYRIGVVHTPSGRAAVNPEPFYETTDYWGDVRREIGRLAEGLVPTPHRSEIHR